MYRRRTKAEILAGVENITQSRVVDYNTVKYAISTDPGTTYIRLHRTDIVVINPYGIVKLNSGGWTTATTKKRMNKYQSLAKIWQQNFEWYVVTCGNSYKFKDNMVITPNGQIIYPGVCNKTIIPNTINIELKPEELPI